MMELASDPESIQFLHGKRISLPLLKNEIDRRMLKIVCLVKRLDKKRRRSSDHLRRIKQQNKHIQTEADIVCHNVEQQALEESSVLGIINHQEKKNRQQINLNTKSHQNEEKKQISKRNTSSKLKSAVKEVPHDKPINASSQRSLTEDHPLIESNGFTFREVQGSNEDSTDRRYIQKSQDDKIFQSLDFGLQISNVEMCNSIISQGDPNRYRTAVGCKQPNRSDALMVSSFTDLSGSELGKTETSKRNRKIRMAGRQVLLPEPQRRIIASEECKDRMERDVESLFGKKRKEVCDYKLRINVLRKIEEKYGQEYSA